MLFKVVTLSLLILLILVILLQVLSVFIFKKKKPNTNPQFITFQNSYLLFTSLVTFADWLNAPYLYKLYSLYGFLEEQVVIIYVCGLVFSLFFDIIAGYVVTIYKDEHVFKFSTILYALSCTLKASSNYNVLIIGRILCGAATSLMFTSQESWYIKTHVVHYDFPTEWITQTQSKASKLSSFVAIAAGAIAYFSTEFFEFGAITPSLISIPLILLTIPLFPSGSGKVLGINSAKDENIDERKDHGRINLKSYFKGMKTIGENPQYMNICIIKALFESVICMFVFLWTPVLDHHEPPLGLVFSSFMTTNLIGYFLHEHLIKVFQKSQSFLLLIISLASMAVLTCALSTSPKNEFPTFSFLSFLLFQLTSGLYFPTMSQLLRETQLGSLDRVINIWFKIPVNILAFCGLLFLHSSTNASGTRHIFFGCFIALIISVLITLRLKNSEDKNTGRITGES